MTDKARKQLFYTILTLEGVLLLSRIIGVFILPVYDDAFITYRYARNLAAGLGYVYQPGEMVLGVTCPAFGLFTSLFYFIHIPMPASIITVNIILDACIVYATFRIFSQNNMAVAGCIFCLLFALSPILERICVGGMEMNLYLCASIGSIILFSKHRQTAAIILSAACYFLRPEGILLVIVLSGISLYRNGWLAAGKLALYAALVIILPSLILFNYYGHLFSQSVLAKSRGMNGNAWDAAKELLFPDPLCVITFPFLIFGIWKSLHKSGIIQVFACWLLAYLAAYLIARPHVWSWYAEPVHYLHFIFAGIGLAYLYDRYSIFARKIPLPRLSAIGGVIVLIFWTGLFVRSYSYSVSRYVYGGIERWCEQNNLKGKTILAGDIGVIGYYSDDRIYDTDALIWPPAFAIHSKDEIISRYSPDYLLMNATSETLVMMNQPAYQNVYAPVARFSPKDISTISANPDDYPSQWVQDYIYIMYQKVK